MQIAKEVGFARVIKYAFFTLWQMVFDLLPFSPLRIWWLKFGGAHVGTNTVIDKIDFINLDRTGLKGLSIGQRCFLGRGTQLDLASFLTLQDWVTVSPRVIILTHTTVGFRGHPLLKLYPAKLGQTQIKTGAFIGAGSIIMSGITIGRRSLIGAGSVVTKSIADRTLAVGVPAKKIKLLK